MKKLILSCLFFTFCLPAYADSSYIVKMGTKVEWAPYHLDAPDGADGIAVKAFACVMARINQPFVIKKRPWTRAQHETKAGKLDGFFAASKNAERDSFATQTDIFIPQERIFYTLKKNAGAHVNDLTIEYIKANMQVGARAGSNTLKSLQKGGYNIAATPQKTEQLVRMLDLGRIGAVLENSLVFPSVVKKMGKSMDNYYLHVQKKKHMGVYFGHGFLEKNNGFLEKFNRNIKPCSLM